MTDPVLTATCFYCGGDIDPLSRLTWQRVVGWQRMAGVRASGSHGGSDIRMREPRDEYAHPMCVDRMKNGLHAKQGTLL